MNPRITLRSIRNHRPCEEGWKTLLTSLGGASVSLDTEVSLGDIARSNGAADAWWCVRAMNWSDIAVRRVVVAALMPAVRRAARHTDDRRVHDCIAALDRWIGGDDSVDLMAAEVPPVRVWAVRTAVWAAEAAVWANRSAERSAWAAVWAAEAEAAAERAAEFDAQRADLIAAFPPLHPERAP